MIDSHCHLDFDTFRDDIDSVLARARQAGVRRFLIPGTTPSGWQRQAALSQQHSDIDVAYGLHPYFLHDDNQSGLHALSEHLSHCDAMPLAIGEIGLDATVDIPESEQVAVLDKQLGIAKDAGLPVILHHRKTHHLLLERLKAMKYENGGVIHAFSGSQQVAEDYIERGFLLGVGGTITYARAQKTRETFKNVPLGTLLLETDSPDMPMSGRQGKRNEPAFIRQVLSSLSELREEDEQHLIAVTSANYSRLFSSKETG
ncbi:TatD family hydrolase [Alteromonas sp. H39]|uniref:TatD family hydrolase n=1 Tax=Alteromonas sp. H39 TaxID=3389876 RepID=UPI0039DFB4BE